MISRGYVGPAGGQIHFSRNQSSNAQPVRLICLHPAPYSGAFFDHLLNSLNGRVNALAPDLPGFGASDALEGSASIEAYSQSISAFCAEVEGQYAIMGYHTGAMVAIEVARHNPDGLIGVLLPGVPYFTIEERKRKAAAFTPPNEDPDHLEALSGIWSMAVSKRNANVPLKRGLQLFSQAALAFPDQWMGFKAAFSYDADAALSDLRLPTTFIPVAGALETATRNAAGFVRGARQVDAAHLGPSPFELSPSQMADLVVEIIDTF